MKHIAFCTLFWSQTVFAQTHTQMQANSQVMNLRVTTQNKRVQLRDTAEIFPGKQTAYYINGQYFGRDLSEFHPLPGTRMAIAKFVLPSHENPLHFWQMHPERKAMTHLAIAPLAIPNTSRIKSSRNVMPVWYEDKTEFRASKFAPKFALIEPKINAAMMKREDATWRDTIGRSGWTHVESEHVFDVKSTFDAPQSARYALLSTHVFDHLNRKNGSEFTRDEIRAVATEFGPYGLLGDQFGEGNAWFAGDSDQAFWFYERAREIANNAQVKWPTTFFGTYGGFHFYNVRSWNGDGGGQVKPNNAWFRKFYDEPKLAATSCSYFNRMVRVTDANVSWYASDLAYADDFYRRVHSVQVMKMGQAQIAPERRTFLFWWNGIENTDNGLIHNGFWWEHPTTNPPGRARYEEHPIVDLDSAIAICLFGGFIVGDGVIGWDNNIQFDSDPNRVGRDQNWTPTSDKTDVQRAALHGYPAHPVNVMSAQFIASQWYQSCARTSGAKWNYVRYRVDNGAWIEAERDGSTILERAADNNLRCGVAMARMKNRAVDWAFHNPRWLPDKEHRITIEAGGKQWSQIVRGNETVLCNETM